MAPKEFGSKNSEARILKHQMTVAIARIFPRASAESVANIDGRAGF
jgi:hypothetical protein